MYDDGNHGDGASGDGQYGGYIPAQTGGQHVRYYIESVSNNSVGTRVYEPAGAEHETYIYKVKSGGKVASEVVINEIMPSNKLAYADPSGEYDDWIELYNNGSIAVDLSGYYLTDNLNEFLQWEFPQGTSIAAGEYLLVWCDGDATQPGLHTNFKLSSAGEKIALITGQGNIADEVDFGDYLSNYTYSRVPNGTGNFEWQHFTPLMSNETPLEVDDVFEVENEMIIYPNPAQTSIHVDIDESMINESISIYNMEGRLVLYKELEETNTTIDVSEWQNAVYVIKLSNGTSRRLVVNP